MSARDPDASTSHDLIMSQRNPSPLPDPVEETPLPPQGYVSPLYQLVFSLLVAFGLIVLIFGSYEIIERAWLSDLEIHTLHLLHTIRGIFTALVVALTVGWIVVRSSPALLAVTSANAEPGIFARERLYAQWFIAMRWIAVLVAALLAFLSVGVFELLPRQVWWPLMITIGILGAMNVFYTLYLPNLRTVRPLLIFQGYIDLIALTVLLHFSGGIENPLAVLMLFHVVIGGILISKRECYRMAATGSLLFAILATGTANGLFQHYPLALDPASDGRAVHLPFLVLSSVGLHATILFLTAYFVSTLSERLRQNEVRLAAMAENALAEHHLLEQALETTSAGLRVLGADLVPFWANDHWKMWFGADQAARDRTQYDQAAAESLRKGGIVVTEVVGAPPPPPREQGVKPARKAEQFFQITSAPLYDASGSVIRVVQLAQDVTPQKQAHAKMMRAGQMAAVGELAGQIAHEVNNPIAIISAKATLLLSDRRGEMSEKIALELDKITDLANRVARIAQGLLSYCRPSPSTHRPLDARLPIRKSLSMIEQRASASGIRIEDVLPPDPVIVPGNAGELEQVFLNLFLNAIHAMPKGGRLTVSMPQAPNGKLGIVVDDTGPGVDAEIRERIFEPFFTTRKEGHGTGLGLSICQGLIRSHGGEVTIGAAPDGGARFTVWLPTKVKPSISSP